MHLLGASIGAWRLASACLPDADAALAQLADDYIHQRYDHAPGKAPRPSHVSALFAAKLDERFGGQEQAVLSHPRYRLHVFTSRGVRALARDGRVRTPLGYLGAFASNVVSRRAMGGFLERVIFSDPRERLPVPTRDYRTRHVDLAPANLSRSILASCSIPFWLDAVTDIAGAPPGPYWDGGITDYHLHLDYAALRDGLVLYPHFQRTLVPGWLDKALRHRHRASARLANVVLLSPGPEWVASLPGAKIPDRSDFKTWGDDEQGTHGVVAQGHCRKRAPGRRVRGAHARGQHRGVAAALMRGVVRRHGAPRCAWRRGAMSTRPPVACRAGGRLLPATTVASR